MPQQLVITFTDEGAVNVQGPIGNKVLSFGMLECAKDAIREFYEKQQQQRVQPASSADIPALFGPAGS